MEMYRIRLTEEEKKHCPTTRSWPLDGRVSKPLAESS